MLSLIAHGFSFGFVYICFWVFRCAAESKKNLIGSKLRRSASCLLWALQSIKQESCKEESIDEKTNCSGIGLHDDRIDGRLQ